jgi:hypothetical protein
LQNPLLPLQLQRRNLSRLLQKLLQRPPRLRRQLELHLRHGLLPRPGRS